MDGCVVIPPAVVCLCVVRATVVAGCDVGGDVIDTWVVCAVAGAVAVGVVCCVVDCVVAATVGEDKAETTITTKRFCIPNFGIIFGMWRQESKK